MSVVEYKAPNRKLTRDFRHTLFLAGAIDMGRARHWQSEVVEKLTAKGADVDIFNPRRDDWDNSWKQTIDDPQFREQVEWELHHLSGAYVVLIFFPKESLAPISLLELGFLVGADARVVVCCEQGFYRRGNIEVLCNFANIALYDELDQAIEVVDSILSRY